MDKPNALIALGNSFLRSIHREVWSL